MDPAQPGLAPAISSNSCVIVAWLAQMVEFQCQLLD